MDGPRILIVDRHRVVKCQRTLCDAGELLQNAAIGTEIVHYWVEIAEFSEFDFMKVGEPGERMVLKISGSWWGKESNHLLKFRFEHRKTPLQIVNEGIQFEAFYFDLSGFGSVENGSQVVRSAYSSHHFV